MTLATAEGLPVADADEYARGYELLEELGALEARIVTHYGRFDKLLNFLTLVPAPPPRSVFRTKSLELEQSTAVALWAVASANGKRLQYRESVGNPPYQAALPPSEPTQADAPF